MLAQKNKILTMALIVMILLIGCTPFEDLFTEELSDYAGSSISGAMSEIEYSNKVNAIIMPFMNDSETFLSHHLEILKGTFPKEQELVLVDSSLDRAQSAIEDIDKLYQPSSCTEHKVETIVKLNEYKDALKRYRKALEEGGNDKIKEAAVYLKSASASLKTAYSVYQQ